MAATRARYLEELSPLLEATLQGLDSGPLEAYLTTHSALPGPRMNLALVGAFAGTVGALVAGQSPPVAQLEALLDGWAALSGEQAPANTPREVLPASAVLSYGQVAVVRPDWWSDEISKLRNAASDGRWRTREMVAAALQRMLAADWPRTMSALSEWVAACDALVIRAAVAAVAEPPLLRERDRAEQALALVATAMDWLEQLPLEKRRDAAVRVLRRALGYAVSVVVAAAPDPGLAQLDRLAQSGDEDLHWVLQENLRKHRLQPWASHYGGTNKPRSGQPSLSDQDSRKWEAISGNP